MAHSNPSLPVITVLLTLSLTAQAQENPLRRSDTLSGAPAVAEVRETASEASPRAGELVFKALSALGVHYKFGGNRPESGFDCSGLMRYVFWEALGLDLPRRAVEISRLGQDIARDQLQPGDLVFFNTLRHTFSHVGLYLGDNRFIHAPARGGQVRIDDMSSDYWAHRFDGARRIAITSGTEAENAD